MGREVDRRLAPAHRARVRLDSMSPRDGYVTRGYPVTPVRWGASHYRRLALEEREAMLAKAALFTDLPKRHLRSIARATTIARHRAGATIVQAGDPGSTFYALIEGEAKVIRGGRTVRRLKPGDFFGEIALLDPGPRTATVVAEADTQCLELASKDFIEVVLGEPRLAERLLRVLAEIIRNSDSTELS